MGLWKNLFGKKSAEKGLKNVTAGVEFELFTLDREGNMVDGAERLINRVRKEAPQVDITEECGKNMIEIRSPYSHGIGGVMKKILNDFESLLFIAEKEGLVLFPYGTYPGIFMPNIWDKKSYRIQQLVFGKQRFSIAARCVGMHCHFSLPVGVFDESTRFLSMLPVQKSKSVLENIYNFFIAIDPALTAFAQCSPFYQGNFLGKDSRVIVYRGGSVLKYEKGLYSKLQEFGALQPYKLLGIDLAEIIRHQYDMWNEILMGVGVTAPPFLKHGSILDINWKPVKINAHGTVEIRGMDMTTPRICVAIVTLVKALSAAIYEKFLEVVPSDEGISLPFKVQGNTITVPPQSFVLYHLQPQSAYAGFLDNDVYNYCKSLLELGKKFVQKNELALLEPLESMVSSRKTLSDEIIESAKKMGIALGKKMTDTQARTLALSLSKDLFKETILAKKAIAAALGE